MGNKESSFSVEEDEDLVSDNDHDATHPFTQKERNDLVCVHLKMVKLLLGQSFQGLQSLQGIMDVGMQQ